MSPDYVPFKLLEINVISAQDLPAVSKMLRTFAVAWIHPDQKLSTRIDHQGHTNPTWNYKLVFRVDKKFLRNETSAITIEIYNVAWLRDLPIGTAQLFVNNLSPPLTPNSPSMRTVALHIRRPSGHLQGILNVGINLIDNGISDSPLRSEISALTLENRANAKDDQENDHLQDSPVLDQKSVWKQELPCEDDLSSKHGSKDLKNVLELKLKTRSMASTNLSMVSHMHPLPSEVAVNLKKGFYSVEGDEYGSSIFENWSEPSDRVGEGLRSKTLELKMEDKIPFTKDHEGHKMKDHGLHKTKNQEGHKTKDHEVHKTKYHHEGQKVSRPKRRRHSDGGGLFSCFGKGFEFTFVCGSKNMKNNRKNIHHHHKLHVNHSDENMHRFYV
ncbi:hypothetical protein ACH5RR_018758 [Cinchona calisaya]|uniref:C2 domain-containing protein n=1 Tax=Cinchona calisaya TaxID=153742 RepID=A0ABD2ZN99_9GENT